MPQGSWTLQWKGLNLYSRGRGLKISNFEGPMILRVFAFWNFKERFGNSGEKHTKHHPAVFDWKMMTSDTVHGRNLAPPGTYKQRCINSVNNGIFIISRGTGFLPSTVPLTSCFFVWVFSAGLLDYLALHCMAENPRPWIDWLRSLPGRQPSEDLGWCCLEGHFFSCRRGSFLCLGISCPFCQSLLAISKDYSFLDWNHTLEVLKKW